MGDFKLTIKTDPVELAAREVEAQLSTGGRVAILVLGMHRSGTSALTRVLNLLGCGLSQRLVGADPTNPAGHWESQAIVDLNEELLEAAGSSHIDWQRLNPGWENSPARPSFMRRAVGILRSEYVDLSFFAIKDPRICRFAPFWLDALRNENIEPRVILPIRNPLEVAASLHTRNGIDPSVGYLIWLRHVLDAEQATRGTLRVFTTYNALLENWTNLTNRVAEHLNLHWPRFSPRVMREIDAFLDRKLYNHQRNDFDILAEASLPSWVRRAYEIFSRWAENGESSADFAALDDISSHLDKAAAAFGRPMALLDEVQAQFQKTQGQLGNAEARFRDAENQLEQLRGELEFTLGRALGAESGAVERSEERNAAVASLQKAEERLKILQNDLASASDKVANLKQALDQRTKERDEAVSRTAETQSALLQRREELRQVWAELDMERERAKALEISLSNSDNALEETNRRLGDASDRISELRAECEWSRIELARSQSLLEREQERSGQLAAAQQDLASTQAALLESKQALEQATKESLDSKAKLAGVEAELEKTHSLARIAVSQRSQTFSEMAVVTQLLRDSEKEVQLTGDTVQWLRQMYTVILKRPRWWFFLSRKTQFERLRRRAERRGLFDSDAYLAKNPDVAATGVDPLKHYITHGIIESRPR